MELLRTTRNLRQRREQVFVEQIGVFDLWDVTNVGHHVESTAFDEFVEGLAVFEWET